MSAYIPFSNSWQLPANAPKVIDPMKIKKNIFKNFINSLLSLIQRLMSMSEIAPLICVTVIFTLFITCTQSNGNNIDYLINETKKNPNSTLAHNKLGLAYFNIGKYNEAIIEFKKVLKIDPNLALVYSSMGSVEF